MLTDDVALPFGQMRLREKGSSGGHNGLQSIQVAIGSLEYARLRIGVGAPEYGELADFVLGKFPKEEAEKLPCIFAQAFQVLLFWVQKDKEKALALASRFRLETKND